MTYIFLAYGVALFLLTAGGGVFFCDYYRARKKYKTIKK